MKPLKKIKWLFAKTAKRILQPPALNNCNIHKTSKVCSASELTCVSLGKYSYIGSRCWAVNAEVGSFCSIADDCRIGGAIHPMEHVSTSPVFHSGKNIMKKNFAEFVIPKTPHTTIEYDVWLGVGCRIKSGVTVHTGAVIGMGSIVTHDVPPYEIWAGNPARKIRDRFDKETAQRLLESKWWEYSDEELRKAAAYFNDAEAFLRYIKDKDNH